MHPVQRGVWRHILHPDIYSSLVQGYLTPERNTCSSSMLQITCKWERQRGVRWHRELTSVGGEDRVWRMWSPTLRRNAMPWVIKTAPQVSGGFDCGEDGDSQSSSPNSVLTVPAQQLRSPRGPVATLFPAHIHKHIFRYPPHQQRAHSYSRVSLQSEVLCICH